MNRFVSFVCFVAAFVILFCGGCQRNSAFLVPEPVSVASVSESVPCEKRVCDKSKLLEANDKLKSFLDSAKESGLSVSSIQSVTVSSSENPDHLELTATEAAALAPVSKAQTMLIEGEMYDRSYWYEYTQAGSSDRPASTMPDLAVELMPTCEDELEYPHSMPIVIEQHWSEGSQVYDTTVYEAPHDTGIEELQGAPSFNSFLVPVAYTAPHEEFYTSWLGSQSQSIIDCMIGGEDIKVTSCFRGFEEVTCITATMYDDAENGHRVSRVDYVELGSDGRPLAWRTEHKSIHYGRASFVLIERRYDLKKLAAGTYPQYSLALGSRSRRDSS
jgi:hypothetical protein